MTRRAWACLAIGSALVVAAAGFSFAHRGSAAPSRPSASWNMYSPTEWEILARRTRLANLHVVSATARSDGTPLALLAGRRGGTTCFVAADALSLRPPVCRLARPVTVFAFPDGPNIAVLGITRADVGSVATRVIEDGRPVVTGEPLLRVPGGFAFGSGYRGSAATVVARDGHGRILARILLGR